MGWFILTQILSTLIQLIGIGRQSDQEKDLEIMILRYQLDMAERKLLSSLRPTRVEKLTLAVLVTNLKQVSRRSASQNVTWSASFDRKPYWAGIGSWFAASGVSPT
jgi:hypothetical protein